LISLLGLPQGLMFFFIKINILKIKLISKNNCFFMLSFISVINKIFTSDYIYVTITITKTWAVCSQKWMQHFDIFFPLTFIGNTCVLLSWLDRPFRTYVCVHSIEEVVHFALFIYVKKRKPFINCRAYK